MSESHVGAEPSLVPETAVSEAVTDAAPVVNRWKRYGKDRLYVTAVEDRKVGGWDLLTDEPHPETPADLAVLMDAVARWKASNLSDVPSDDVPSVEVDASRDVAPVGDVVVVDAKSPAGRPEEPAPLVKAPVAAERP